MSREEEPGVGYCRADSTFSSSLLTALEKHLDCRGNADCSHLSEPWGTWEGGADILQLGSCTNHRAEGYEWATERAERTEDPHRKKNAVHPQGKNSFILEVFWV